MKRETNTIAQEITHPLSRHFTEMQKCSLWQKLHKVSGSTAALNRMPLWGSVVFMLLSLAVVVVVVCCWVYFMYLSVTAVWCVCEEESLLTIWILLCAFINAGTDLTPYICCWVWLNVCTCIHFKLHNLYTFEEPAEGCLLMENKLASHCQTSYYGATH